MPPVADRIAHALALNPRMLILDEPVSALDKSVEARVLNLLGRLKRELNLTYMFISHDLYVVQYIADRVMVMYLGQVVELGPVDAIYLRAWHPYSTALLECRLVVDPATRIDAPPLVGDPPNPIHPPSGCRFRTRCPYVERVCEEHMPMLRHAVLHDRLPQAVEVGPRHAARCVRLEAVPQQKPARVVA